MITSNIQFRFLLTRGGGQAVQGGLSCPPPRISERMDNPQILLHYVLQEYLVERDINFISANLICLLQMFSWVMYWQGVGGKLSRAVYLAPPPRISERIDNTQILLHHLLQEYLVERDVNFISVSLRCLLQTFSWVTYWQRGARWLSGRVLDSGARGPGFETYLRRVVSLSKTLYSPKVLVNYPGSDGSVPTWLKNCWLGR